MSIGKSQSFTSFDAFNGNVARDPFCFQKFGVSNIRQLVRGVPLRDPGTSAQQQYPRFERLLSVLTSHWMFVQASRKHGEKRRLGSRQELHTVCI